MELDGVVHETPRGSTVHDAIDDRFRPGRNLT